MESADHSHGSRGRRLLSLQESLPGVSEPSFHRVQGERLPERCLGCVRYFRNIPRSDRCVIGKRRGPSMERDNSRRIRPTSASKDRIFPDLVDPFVSMSRSRLPQPLICSSVCRIQTEPHSIGSFNILWIPRRQSLPTELKTDSIPRKSRDYRHTEPRENLRWSRTSQFPRGSV